LPLHVFWTIPRRIAQERVPTASNVGSRDVTWASQPQPLIPFRVFRGPHSLGRAGTSAYGCAQTFSSRKVRINEERGSNAQRRKVNSEGSQQSSQKNDEKIEDEDDFRTKG